jgi:Tol biopolymer transport system component
MPLQPGSRIGSYEIIGALGAGGMGEVYRARDSKLGREVALKVLPEAFASDHDRIARFEREAQVLASLNHPHIAHIHGFESSQDSRALVMELVEGPTLADRLRAGPIPLDEALAIARQIAEALEAAHERGIIHRDLKPANIKVTDEGIVKVLDFGLAKAIEPAVTGAAVSQSPTLSIHATQAGIVLGTAAYMSPEQARGKPADARADIWAFGVVLFEMLAGRSPFEGEEITDILASVLKTEPQWNRLPRDLPAPVDRLLRRCLQKDRRQRLQHIGDARLELADATGGDVSAPPSRGVSWRERAVWVALVVAVAVLSILAFQRFTPPVAAPEMRVDVPTPDALIMWFSLSPDGQSIAYSARSERGPQIWLRDLSSTAPRAVRGTEGGEYPFWSPDGRHLGFFAGNRLKRISVDGGTATALASSLTPAGGSWGADGTILYVPADNGSVRAISEKGGESRPVTDRIAARLPQFLPGGRRFLFYASSGIEPTGVYAGDLDTGEMTHVIGADFPAQFVGNQLIFVRDRTLYAQSFDPNSLTLNGSPQRLADEVVGGLFAANFAVSQHGTIAYRTGGGARSGRQLIWFDRSGKRLQAVGDEGGLLSNPSLSPDGRHVAVQRTTDGNVDVWIIDLQRNTSDRLTSHAAVESLPLWSPDGLRIALGQSAVPGGPGVLAIDRPSQFTPLGIKGIRAASILCDWSRDGRHVMFKAASEDSGAYDLWVLTLDGDRKQWAIADAAFDERDGQFSPDGRWVAFESDESGAPEIYVQPFPGPGRRVRVSTNGGSQVRWRDDGRELFYVAPDETLMAVSIATSGSAPSIQPPVKLFATNLAPVRAISRQQYVVSRDGQRFLMVHSPPAPVPPVTLFLNWRGFANR